MAWWRRRRREKVAEDPVIGHYDAGVESRLLGVSGPMDLSPYRYRLFRRRRTTPVHREAHYGEGEDPELGPPF